jgi:hypothetical protein
MNSITNEHIVVIDETYDEATLSNQQIDAGNEIIENFLNSPNGVRWVILLAQMQSGKTETYLFVCCELIRRSVVNSVVIFSGNAETDLRDQLKKEIKGHSKFYSKYEIYLEEKLTISTRMRQPIKDKIINNIKILWGTDLNKNADSYTNTLFIWEEAHHAQSIHQCPDKFLKNVGVSADGDSVRLSENGNFVISISATPFSELSDIFHHQQNKEVVYMRPGIGYNSVKNILDSGRLKSFDNVENGLKEALRTPHDSHKYGIVRISNKNEDTIKRIIQDCGWNFVVFDSLLTGQAKELGQKTWDGMKQAPERDTVILLRGKCRMGKNLEKEHVLFVMETAKTSNTDTVLQGLLGRVCGYSKGSDKVDVYLHQKIIRSGEIQRYIDLTEGQDIIPSKACNLEKTTIFKTRYPIVPFMVSNVDTNGDSRSRIIRKVLQQIGTSDFDFGKTDSEQFQEIKERLLSFGEHSNSGVEIEVHYVSKNLNETNEIRRKKWHEFSEHIRYFNTSDDTSPITLWHTGIEKVKRDGTILEEGRIINIFYYKDNNEQYGIQAGSAFIYGVTEKANRSYVFKTNIPKTTGREVFAHSLEDGSTVVSNGGFTIKMPIETSRNLVSMKDQILYFAQLTLEFPDSRSVDSQWDNKNKKYTGILVNQEIRDALLPGGEIYREVFDRFGFTISMVESSNRLDERIRRMGFTRFASICW